MARAPAKPPSQELIVAATVGGDRQRFLKANGKDWVATLHAREAHDFGDAGAAQDAVDEFVAKGGDRYVRGEPGQWRAWRLTLSFAPAA